MSLVPYVVTAIRSDDDGTRKNVVPFVLCTILNEIGTPAAVYSNQAGAPLANPFLLDYKGQREIWLEPGIYSQSVAGSELIEFNVSQTESDIDEKLSLIVAGERPVGAWDAETNTPALTDSSGAIGDVYYVSVAGDTDLNGENDWDEGSEAVKGVGGWFKRFRAITLAQLNSALAAFLVTLYNIFPRKINTWADIATTSVVGAGQLFTLAQHTSGGLGGGTLMAFAGSVTDDGGLQKNSSTPGFYLKRIFNGPVTPAMYGALGDNSTNDLSVCQAMFSSAVAKGYRDFDFEGKTYFLGLISVTQTAKFVFNAISGLRIKGGRFRVTTAFATQDILFEAIFKFVDCSDLFCSCYANGQTGFDLNAPQASGVVGVWLVSDKVDAKGVEIHSVVEYGSAAVRGDAAWITIGSPDNRARLPTDPFYSDMKIFAVVNYGKYGCDFNVCGDNTYFNISTTSVTRSLFINGLSNVIADVNSKKHRFATDVLIKAYNDNVQNITVNLVQRESTSTEDVFAIEHENYNPINTTISNLILNINTDRTSANVGLFGAIDTVNGGYLQNTLATTENVTVNWEGPGEAPIRFLSAQTKPANIRINRIWAISNQTTKGFTLQSGTTFRCMEKANVRPLRFKIDGPSSTGYSAVVHIRNTSDYTDVTAANRYSGLWLVTWYRLSGGGGVVQSTTMVSQNVVGVAPNFTWGVSDGCLTIASDLAGANSVLSATVDCSGDRFC